MWTWYQREGVAFDPAGTFFCRGYSGAPGYVNDPASQHLKGRGPIPRGMWKIGAPEACCGGCALRLSGLSRDEPHRDRFLIHGDASPETADASQGCIIIPRWARQRIWESGDHLLSVLRERLPASTP